jgi:uridylate kinase
MLLKATNVDGVYSSDPKKTRGAKFYKQISLSQAIRMRLGVMDTTALALCQENNLSIRVFNLHTAKNIARTIQGQAVGTLVRP